MKNILKFLIVLAVFIPVFISQSNKVEAAIFTYNTTTVPSSYYGAYYSNRDVSVSVVGHNVTHGVTKELSYTLTPNWWNGTWGINYIVPDDGCTWNINGTIYTKMWINDGNYLSAPRDICSESFTATHTTAGSFSGPSAKTATDAANAAAGNTSYNGQSAGYWSYYAYANANSANINASNAATYSSWANSNASAAASNTSYSGQSAGYWSYSGYNQAASANTNAANAASWTWDSSTSKSAATLAREARDSASTASSNASSAYSAVNNANGNTITAVRDAGGTVLEEARQSKTNALNAYNKAVEANNKIENMQSQITNIENKLGIDISPPAVRIRTVSGAAATSGNSIQGVLEISDNASSNFIYSLDGTTYSAVPINKIVSLPVNNPGSNVITVLVKDQAGNIGSSSITIRRL